MVWLDTETVARPVAALGNARDWKMLAREEFKPRWPAGVDLREKSGKYPALFVWSDLNNDAQVQPDEVQMTKASEIGSVTVAPDLSFIAARAGPSAIATVPPARILWRVRRRQADVAFAQACANDAHADNAHAGDA